jgi:hypothetical protein
MMLVVHPRDFLSRLGLKTPSRSTLQRWHKRGLRPLSIPRGHYVEADVRDFLLAQRREVQS